MYYWVMSALSLLGTLMFLLVRKPRVVSLAENKIINASEMGGAVETGKFRENVSETFKMMVSKKMMRIIPLITWSALSLATFTGSFVTLMVDTMSQVKDEDEQLKLSLFALVPLGVGQMIGGAIMG